MTSPQIYVEPEKIRARAESLSYAVSLLTKDRNKSAVVPVDYVHAVRKALLNNEANRELAAHCDSSMIRVWETLRNSVIGQKRPEDLVVAYLAGPAPLNDFRELVKLGVHPYNIWAFESEETAFRTGLASVRVSEFPLLKLQKGSIDTFFQSVPRIFDLIYIDACGPLPSVSQGTLRTIANIFRYNRLASPGVLITNFASPDISDTQQLATYSELISGYLWPKAFLESGKPNWNMTDGPRAHGLSPLLDDEDSPTFFDEVKSHFHFYYGQYITRQIFDLASFIAPWARFANSEMWKTLFTIAPKEAAEKARYLQYFDAASEGGDFIVDPDVYEVGWAVTALRPNDDQNYPRFKSSDKLRISWAQQLSGHPLPSVDAVTAILAYYCA